MSDLKVLEDFPDYGVTKEGEIHNLKTGKVRSLSFTREGAVKVTLFREGKPFTKSLPRLVADAWVENPFNPEIFDTPIHLDNDLSNNHVSNLAWRPRWFAVKYQRQYWNEEYRYAKTKVQDIESGELFVTLIDVCQRYGFLYVDVLKSCTTGVEVFPSWRQFRFID